METLRGLEEAGESVFSRAPHMIQACKELSRCVPVEKHLDYLDFQSSLGRPPSEADSWC